MNESSSIAVPSRLAVTYRAVGDLIPDPRNARTHPKRQIDQIKASIDAFGFTNPILADPDGHIIAGHGRLQAARAMGFSEVPTITLSGLSDTQKRALRIADNKIALNAGWDLEILQLELSELASIDIDIDPTLTGFSTGEIDVILSSAGDPDDEVIPPVPTTPRTKPGDILLLLPPTEASSRQARRRTKETARATAYPDQRRSRRCRRRAAQAVAVTSAHRAPGSSI